MRKILIGLFLIIDIILLGLSNNEFNTNKDNYVSNNIIASIEEESILNYKNIYYQDINFNYVSNSTSTILTNKQDILNLLYTTINNGYDEIEFSCSSEYLTCYDDLTSTINDGHILSIINNLVHPYNSAQSINLAYLNNDLKLSINKIYSNNEIEYIDNRINNISSQIITTNMTDRQKIKKVHDYLANNISYNRGYKSNTAYGALFYKEAICSGYSDVLALFLTKLNIPNYKVVTNNHVWNVLYIDNTWLHIDLTYDDPSNIYSTNTSNYNFFLISTNEIIKDKYDHNLDLRVYSELS